MDLRYKMCLWCSKLFIGRSSRKRDCMARFMQECQFVTFSGTGIVARKVESIPADKEARKDPVWVKEDGVVWVTCPWCGSVMDVLADRTYYDGRCSMCSICPECGRHVFYALDEWNGGL